MSKPIFEWPTRHPILTVLVFFAIAGASVAGLFRLKEEQDLLVFLPTDDPDVRLFSEVSHRFGSVNVAMIGVAAPRAESAADDLGVFAPAVLAKIKAATDAIGEVHGIAPPMSLSHITNFVAGPAGADVRELMDAVPKDDAEARALKATALSRKHINGTVVSSDGRAALILVFLLEHSSERAVTDELRAIAHDKLAGLDVYFAGAPFAGRAIYEEAQADVWRLSPVALLMLLLVVILSFRDPVGVVLTVASVAFAILVVLGGMGWWGEKFTVASSTLPVILFASGSSYAVHVLGRYYLLRQHTEARAAINEALRIVGPPLLIAAGTTSVGFFSFIATDVRPMRAFGIACGAGVLICWVTSLTLVPAVVALWPRRSESSRQLGVIGAALVAVWHWSRRRRLWVAGFAVLTIVSLLAPMFRVKVRMEPNTFFRKGSEPWKAERFMDERFGGAHFIQIPVHGDLDDPWTLREMVRLQDFVRAQPGVSQVQSMTDVLTLATEVAVGVKRLPATSAQLANIYFTLEGQAGISQLLHPGRKDALVQVRLHAMSLRDTEALVERLERFAKDSLRARPMRPTVEDCADRVAWVASSVLHHPVAEDRPTHARLENALRLLALPGDRDPEWTDKRVALVKAWLGAEEAPRMTPETRDKLLGLVRAGTDAGADDWKKTLAAAGPSPEEGALAVADVGGRLEDARRDLGVARALPLVIDAAGLGAGGNDNKRLSDELRPAVEDLFVPGAPGVVTAREPLSARIAGEPILNRGFSHSVERNQLRSLCIACALVLAMLVGLFRSLWQAIVCMSAALLTMVLMFGVMGLLGISIDLGTSLVAGIATGAGSDFAMHYMWYLRRDSADDVSRTVGPVMVVSVLLVGLGFIVLALGKSPVMHLFGTLAGVAMILSALLTCLMVPALLNKVGPGRGPNAKPEESSHS